MPSQLNAMLFYNHYIRNHNHYVASTFIFAYFFDHSLPLTLDAIFFVPDLLVLSGLTYTCTIGLHPFFFLYFLLLMLFMYFLYPYFVALPILPYVVSVFKFFPHYTRNILCAFLALVFLWTTTSCISLFSP